MSNTFKATYILFIKSISEHTKINPQVTELRGKINETLAKIFAIYTAKYLKILHYIAMQKLHPIHIALGMGLWFVTS